MICERLIYLGSYSKGADDPLARVSRITICFEMFDTIHSDFLT